MYLFLLRCITRHHYHFHLYIPKCIYFYHVWICAAGYGYRSLHSKMYLFLPAVEEGVCGRADLYIPKCIYFYVFRISIPSKSHKSLHSKMYLFLLLSSPITTLTISLYIPKCIYFYRLKRIPIGLMSTLHSKMYLFLQDPVESGKQ